MAEEQVEKQEEVKEQPQEEQPAVKEIVEPDGRRLYELVVDGVVRRVDARQLVQAAQKGLAVLPKIQQERDKLVEQLRKSAEYVEPAFEVVDALNKWATSDDPEEAMQAGQKLGEALGLSAEDIAKIYQAAERGATDEELLEELLEPQEETGEEEERQERPREKRPALRPEDLKSLIQESVPELKELQQEIAYLRERRAQEWRDHLGELLNTYIENDAELGKMVAQSPKVRVALLKLGWEALRSAVALEGRLPGPETFQRVVRHLREAASDLGAISSQPEDERTRIIRTLGPAAEAFDEELLKEISRSPSGSGAALAGGVGASGATSADTRRAFRARLIEEIVKGGGLQPEG